MEVDPHSVASKSARTNNLLTLIQKCSDFEARVKLLEHLDSENKDTIARERDARIRAEKQLDLKQEVNNTRRF